MAANSRDQVLSLLAAANNHGDLAVKLSSLRQVKDLLSSSQHLHSIAPQVFPFLIELQSSPRPLVRKLLIEVIEEMGLRVLEHSLLLLPVLLALSKDGDPDVSYQAIATGTKFFSALLEELTRQFHLHGKVERWTEEMWIQMIEFKDAVLSLVFEPACVGTRLMALKFLECFILQFTPDIAASDRRTSGGSERGFNISWVANGHPVLDAVKVSSEANRLFSSLLDILHSSSSIPGPLTIAIVNCLAAIARKRPDYYGSVLSALLSFQSETTRRGHTASLQYSVRTALLGFLRCTHPVILESRDKLVRTLQSMNAGDAVDQVLRQIDKIIRNNERSLRESRVIKDDLSTSQMPVSGVLIKRKLASLDNREPTDSPEMAPKRTCYNSNEQESDLRMNEAGDDNPANGISAEVPLLNDDDPVEQMIVVIAALLAQGDKASDSVDLLISRIHPDLLADIVMSNMKHLPKTPPAAKQGSVPLNGQSNSAASVVRGAAPELPVSPSVVTPQGPIPTTSILGTSLPDSSSSASLPADSRRDPRRDPRRLDPRKLAAPVEVEDSNCVESRLEGLLPVNDLTSVSTLQSAEHIAARQPEIHVDEKSSRMSLVSETEKERPREEAMDRAEEISSTSNNNVLIDYTLSPAPKVIENSTAQMASDIVVTDATDAPFVPEFDHYSPPVSDASPSEETCVDLPQVPSYVDLSQEQTQMVSKLAVERIIRSFKELKNKEFCQTRMAILSKMVPWMEADDSVTTMVQEDIVSGYREQQGHELVMHVLYYLHGLMTPESSGYSPGAAVLYEKFLLGMAKSLINTLPASDKSFSRLLGEAPSLTDSVMSLLENLCCPDGSDRTSRDIRDDRITQGLGTVWSLILGRPVNRQPCLTIALKCAFHPEDDTRAKAIRLVANKLYPLDYVSDSVEQYATNMLLSAVNAEASQSGSTGPKREDGVNLDASVSGSQPSASGSFDDNLVKDELPASQTGVSMSLGEAQRMISLYFALCTKKPDLLKLVFDVYARSGRNVKQAFHRHVPILLRALGSSYSQLLRIISNPPLGSENLLMLVLQILAEQTTPSPDLISTVKHLYETKLKDATILIPMLSSLSRNEVLPIFARLVDLPLDKFQLALARILQGSAHTGPALTPAEVLVAIHDIVPEKEGIALKKVTDACSACFEQRTVFTQHVLAKALSQMVDRTPLPLLFMRTVIQAIDAFPTLVDFVMEILSKLISRQIWKMPKLWVGFLKCVSQTLPHSFQVLLQLPAPQLESALNKYANLRGPLAAYSSQPSIKASLPRKTLEILGIVHESQFSESQNATPLHTPDSNCVRGTST
ncbi:uncharacterized protein LOC141586415 [Silene latifolia]|uniref:uncharacterized protein LOC141586415 n=1 Tax=Silene latifolia TaxID=37657 RepID=UPI003D77978F